MLPALADELRALAAKVDQAAAAIPYPTGDITTAEAKRILKGNCRQAFWINREIRCDSEDTVTHTVCLMELNYKSFHAGRLADAVAMAMAALKAANEKVKETVEGVDLNDAKEVAGPVE